VGWGAEERAGSLRRKKINFCPQIFLTGKLSQSLEALGHALYSSVAERSLQRQCKNYQKIHGQTTVAQFPAKYAMPMVVVAQGGTAWTWISSFHNYTR